MPTDELPYVTRTQSTVRIMGQTFDLELKALPGVSTENALLDHRFHASRQLEKAQQMIKRIDAALLSLVDQDKPTRPAWTPTELPDGSHRMGVAKLGSLALVASVLGRPNVEDDPEKVAASYAGSLTLPDGRKAVVCLWDYKGSAEGCGKWSVHCKPVYYMNDAIRCLEAIIPTGKGFPS